MGEQYYDKGLNVGKGYGQHSFFISGFGLEKKAVFSVVMFESEKVDW